ncbi:MAG TPA: hypothetical protein VF746_29445 [Longimicrobium sp.]|jgi:hypothetical protein
MFSRISRYRDLPDVVTVDARGRAVRSRSLRLAEPVDGVLVHTLEEGDRLDHLAQRYYGQPRSWWRIVDANPEFLSPHALVGREPRGSVVVPLEWTGAAPPWADLLRALRDTPGVEAAATGTPAAGEASAEALQGAAAFTLAPTLVPELQASARAQRLTPALDAALRAKGVQLTDVRIETPDPARWRVTDLRTRRVRLARLSAGPELTVYDVALRHRWAVEVAFNRLVLEPADVPKVAERLGFVVGPPRELRRIGAPVAVPPRPV